MNLDSHIGHKKVIKLLKKQVATDRLSHAYIFIGSPNIGKYHLAKYFATMIYGQENKEKIAKKIISGIYPDMITIEPIVAKKAFKSSISLKQIRDLRKKINLSPHSSQYKVGIIRNAHLMTIEASNAFLKTLEEPTKTSILILTTSKESLLLPTILSRCQRIYLGLVDQRDIIDNLESSGVSVRKAKLISLLSSGRPGVSINLSKDGALDKYYQSLDLLENLIKMGDVSEIEKIKKISEEKNITEMLDNWLIYFRDLYAQKNNIDEIIINRDRMEKIKKIGEKFSKNQFKKCIELVKESQNMLSQNANPRLVLENLLFSIKA